MENPVDRVIRNWIPAGAGFVAAVVAILWLRPFPGRADTLEAVLALYGFAVSIVLFLVGTSAVAAFLAWALVAALSSSPRPPRFTWRIASRAAWVAPVYMFALGRSGWAMIAAACWMLGVVYALRILQPGVKQSPAWSSGWKVFSCVVAGASIEGALIVNGSGRVWTALPIAALATFIIVWHATRAGRHGHWSRGLVTVVLAIIFTSGAIVRNVTVRPGDGFLGYPMDPLIAASLFSLQKVFSDSPAVAIVPNRPEAGRRGDTTAEVEGLPHLGIFLWPDVKKDTQLVPPLPSLGRMAFGKDHKSPLTIPFYGVYWFFRFPYRQPPPGSAVMHGSPAVRSFVSNDRSPLWEEAHQNLQATFDLTCCKGIEMDVTNADPKADLVEIELTVADTRKMPRIVQSLGKKRLITTPGQSAVPETLGFDLPANSKLKAFDELVVRFRLVTPRWSESAKIAIERFRLVPKSRR